MRKVAVALAVAALAVTAGCLGGGGGSGPSEEQLEADATYQWQTDADVSVNVTSGQYFVVASVDNETELRFSSSDTFGGRTPLSIAAVKFRYPNGTVVDADDIEVATRNSRTVVTLPASDGQFAYRANAGSRSVSIPVAVEGSHEVALPPGMRVTVPVLSVVEPSGYRKTVEDNRVVLRWESLDGGRVSAQYYLQRDLFLFAGIIAVLSLAAVLGVVYYRIRIRRLEDEREAAGLDVEE
jgi:hypothetical protein